MSILEALKGTSQPQPSADKQAPAPPLTSDEQATLDRLEQDLAEANIEVKEEFDYALKRSNIKDPEMTDSLHRGVEGARTLRSLAEQRLGEYIAKKS